MDNKLFFLCLLVFAAVVSKDIKNNDDKSFESGVAANEDEQDSEKDNITVTEENGDARDSAIDLQQRYWPLCEQLTKFVPQLCLRRSVAAKCSNVCNNIEPVLDCGIKIPPNPTKKKEKKKLVKTKKQKKKTVAKGKTDKGAKRIVGGKVSAANEWNWQVFISGKSTQFNYHCGAAILSKNFILTAGHCIDQPLLSDPDSWTVTVGDHNKYVDEAADTKHKVKHIMRHKDYQKLSSGILTNDVTIFQLEDAIDIEDENKGRICLPDEDKPIPDHDKTCYVTGWGRTKSGQASDLLKHAPVLMIPRSICNLPLSHNGQIDETMFCAGHKQGQDGSCSGDSGGTLACKMGTGLDERWYSSGVVSWGDMKCDKHEKYGVYANTTYFKDWIVDTILDESIEL